MFRSLRQRHPGASLTRVLFRASLRIILAVVLRVVYRLHVTGVERFPASGGVLLLCNHQSFMDPVILGVAIKHRHFYAMARRSLFGNPLFGWLIRVINAIPVERGAADLKAMRLCVDLLQQGQGLLVFPEGMRTSDGATLPFKPGPMLLIRRAKPMVVPVAIQGAFEVWPRQRLLPRLRGRIAVACGEPIPAAQLLTMNEKDALDHLHDQVESLRLAMTGYTDNKSQPAERAS